MATGTIADKLPSANQILEPSPIQLMLRRVLGHAGMTFGGGVLILIFAAALCAPILAPHDPYTQDLTKRFLDPVWGITGSWEHPLGTDKFGGDYLSRMLLGAHTSLLSGFSGMRIAGPLGTA